MVCTMSASGASFGSTSTPDCSSSAAADAACAGSASSSTAMQLRFLSCSASSCPELPVTGSAMSTPSMPPASNCSSACRALSACSNGTMRARVSRAPMRLVCASEAETSMALTVCSGEFILLTSQLKSGRKNKKTLPMPIRGTFPRVIVKRQRSRKDTICTFMTVSAAHRIFPIKNPCI